ncbi:segregation and condensation protein A [Streptomyces parvulus]|uniref:segregation and condensation protein A n=1 Tax=Streptomyces parvulus TaxID=146923 RepID=UPI0033AEE99F
MTSNDASSPGPRAGRRRALGRGPGESPAPATLEQAPPLTGSGDTRAEPPPEAEPAQVLVDDPAAELPTDDAPAGVPVDDVPAEVPAGEPPAALLVEEAPAEVPPEVVSPGPGPEGDGDGVFKVRLANFEGPFDLLLQLISRHKMDVTEVALSKVTDEFMAHIRGMGSDWDLDETTEFLVVAATLLDLKAARLLPAAEVEDEADLALLEARDLLFARLLQYRAYKQIAEIFNERLESEARRYPRTVGLEPHHAELLPEVVISIGPEGFARLAVKAMQPKPKPQVYVEHIHAPLVSVQEQAGIVVARLRELGEASFGVLVQDTADTLTVVARFLALLELYREKAVELDQETALGDLLVRWTGGDGDTGPVVTDEFDRPPEQPDQPEKPEKPQQTERTEEEWQA